MTEQDGSSVQVRIDTGIVAGVEDRGCVRFRGIPFAAPPFGQDRFRHPRPPEPWEGVRDASASGPGVPQPSLPDDPWDGYFNPQRQGEDCLTLDVWTPDAATAGLPVMVWIHGGGFMTGTGSAPAHDGFTFARDGIVHVGINYRLGIDGFTYLGEGTDNLGLRDQVAALEWVQRNIARFGGDPSRVTVFGQSAGALSVMDLLAMPSARGLFARAIAQSGSPLGPVAAEDALSVTARIAERLGVAATRDAFAEVPVARTVAEVLPMTMEFADPRRWGSRSFMVSPYRAVYGTPSLPEAPMAVAPSSSVPLLTGTVRNETTGFLQALGSVDSMNWLVGRSILSSLGVDGGIRRAYRGTRDPHRTIDLVEAAWTDWAFRAPTVHLVERRTAPSFLYEFRWESPAFPPGLGANHAMEVPFVRDDLATARAIGPAGELMYRGAPEGLASRMHRAWVDFAVTGDPGWPAYETSERQTMVFDTESAVESDPSGPERVAWGARRQ
ncbi:carboxylesterase type B [Microbacterium resistens]|uniref:Carboxylic ester hydrolase n=1 Tax=Microbacterium resistens TaxID=156977 RepID=A0ABU1SD26_9MICO|nr:carboxylesterase family protein [Microbacterium resistens]MDR6867494.1 carboxylesterase type B [Microbacterium resistens]